MDYLGQNTLCVDFAAELLKRLNNIIMKMVVFAGIGFFFS